MILSLVMGRRWILPLRRFHCHLERHPHILAHGMMINGLSLRFSYHRKLIVNNNNNIYFSLANTQTKAMVRARVWKLSCKVAWRMINESDGTPSTLDRSFFFGKLSQAWDAKSTCHSQKRGWSKHSETIITISRQISEKHCQFFRKRAFISSKELKKSLDKKKETKESL